MKEKLAIVIGIMSILIILYRITYLMIPMLMTGIHTNNLTQIMESLTLLI